MRHPWQREAILIFGLRYIFQRQFSVLGRGAVTEAHTRQEGEFVGVGTVYGFTRDSWPDGVLRVAKILKQVSRSGGVVLLEEPELGLEPRAVRRLFDFLCWAATPDEAIVTSHGIVSKIQDAWSKYVTEIQSSREDPVQMPKRTARQFFISSHSPTLLNKFLELEQSASVYEFTMRWTPNGFDPNAQLVSGRFSESAKQTGWMEQDTQFSYVRQVNSQAQTVLDELGASGADLLQCNGVIWVEGPSDVIYIKAWLDMYANENGLVCLQQGRDYQFQMYGGALLASLSLQGELDEEKASAERNRLVDMFSFSRNAYVVMDSDAVANDEGVIEDRSTFANSKKFIRDEIKRLNDKGFELGLWYAESDTVLRTIEDYLDPESRDLVSESVAIRQKVRAAQIRTADWSQKKLACFPEASKEIAELFRTISRWQGD